jgi:hypothetical protein
MAQITLEEALSIIDRAKNCLICYPIADHDEVVENTMKILDECQTDG